MRIAEQLNYTVPCASMLWGQFQFSDDVYGVQFHKCWQDFSTRSSIIFFNKKLRLDASSILRETDTGTRQSPVFTKRRQRAFLPWVFRRAHDKVFAVCKTRRSAKKRELTAADGCTDFTVCHDSWHTAKRKPLPCARGQSTRQRVILCRVPWLLHTAKIFSRPA